jgi:predicted dinucleotide-binding enzyme
MKISLIGTGNMGSALAQLISKAGYRLTLTGRDAAKAEKLAQGVSATYQANGVAAGADLVILATGYGDAVSALKAAGDLTGKVVVDITNPLTPDYMGLTLGYSTSAAEEIQKAFPGAKVVKAFNTLFAQVLGAGPQLAGQTVPVFFAGNDADAKGAVKSLIQKLGFDAVDAGSLKNARYLEPLGALNVYLGYGAERGTAIAPKWIGVK